MFIALYQKVGPIFHLINWNLHMIFINFVRIYVWGNTCSFSPLKLYVSILSHQLIQRVILTSSSLVTNSVCLFSRCPSLRFTLSHLFLVSTAWLKIQKQLNQGHSLEHNNYKMMLRRLIFAEKIRLWFFNNKTCKS